MNSPWHDLPTSAPYILPSDLARIEKHSNFPNLRLDTVPEQVVGGLNKAEIVFLALNPGFAESDLSINLNLPDYLDDNRRNLIDPHDSPFYFFSEGHAQTGGYLWWAQKLKPIIQSGVSTATLREKIMLIEYFPYHSVSWDTLPTIPSQKFAFNLVNEAIDRNKIIILMRARKLWFEAVPKLDGYKNYLELNSALNVTISRNNLDNKNGVGTFDKIVAILSA